MSVDQPSSDPHEARGSVSWPSKNNRHGPREGGETVDLEITPDDMPGGVGLRPLSVEAGRSLRDEAVLVETPEGYTVPVSQLPDDERPEGEVRSRPWYRVVSEWRDWYDGYRRSHIEYQKDGEIARTKLENSYQPEYGKRYYAKLKDLERGIEREFESLTTVMLTFTASTENAKGGCRCPADHMRDIADGWDTARKQLYKTLSGRKWEYAKVWEPHESGYGHMHVGVFVEGEVSASDFRPVMESYVDNCAPAGSGAHQITGTDAAVSVQNDVENLGSYISEYIGIFGEEALDRPMKEQAFYAVAWATGTRRLDFSNGAQDIIAGEKFRRETGLRPEDRGEGGASEPGESGESESEWDVTRITTVTYGRRSHADPTAGGASKTAIDGREGVDPPPERP